MKLTCQTPARIALTGTLTTGSAVVTGLSSTTGLVYGLAVQGTGIPADSYVLSVDSATQVTLNQNATATGAKALTFFLEPVTLAAMKNHLRVDILNDDALIIALIAAARLYCEAHLKQALLTSTWLLELDCFPRDGIIRLPCPPLQSVTSLQYVDLDGTLQTIDPTDYIVSVGTPGRIEKQFLTFWPIVRPTIDCVKVTFIAGYGIDAGSVPPQVYGAVNSASKLLVGHWYKHREAVNENGVQFAQVPMTVDLVLGAVQHGSYS